MIKTAVFNFKGGTGKSTTTLNLGAAIASQGHQTLLIDLDGQRTLSYGLGLDGDLPTALDFLQSQTVEPLATNIPHLFLIPGALEMFNLTADKDLFTPALAKLTTYQFCFMDCSPGLGIASVQAILSGDRILIPVVGEPAALKGLSEAIQLIRNERPTVPIDVLRVRYRPRLVLTKEADTLLESGATELGFDLLQTVIPENIAVAEAIAHQTPVTTYAPKSQGAQAYHQLAQEYRAKLP
ncbi:MAG: ParA family protein [Snowella sp.]|nr:ParA family protein [Snowella sp.]